MADPGNDPRTGQGPARDPVRSTLRWIAGFLRVGIGLALLNRGLSEFVNRRNLMRNGMTWGSSMVEAFLEPLVSILPYVAIGLGLALILGFLTRGAAIASAFYSLLSPFLVAVQLMATAGTGIVQPGLREMLSFGIVGELSNLLPFAAMIWLSTQEYHPISIDTLILGRSIRQNPDAEPAEPEPAPEPEMQPVVSDLQSSG